MKRETNVFTNYRLVGCLLVSGVLHLGFVYYPFVGERDWSRLSMKRNHGLMFISARLLPLNNGQEADISSVKEVLSEESDNPSVDMQLGDEQDVTERKLTDGVGISAYGGEDYFLTAELSVKPQTSGELIIPFGTEVTDSGRVVFLLWINSRGKVVHIEVEHGEQSERFLEQVKEAFGNLQFTPGELKGRRVGTVMRVEVGSRDDYSDAN